jgi:hypothetical protein
MQPSAPYEGPSEESQLKKFNPNGMIWQESCHIDFVLPPELIIDSGIFRYYCNVLFSLSYVTAKLSPAG